MPNLVDSLWQNARLQRLHHRVSIDSVPSLRAVDCLQLERSASACPDDLVRVPALGVQNCQDFLTLVS